jgi:histidyl-tRNA synthetase
VRAEFEARRLKDLLGHASEEEIAYVIIIGEDEMRDQCVKVKDMAGRTEEIVAIDRLNDYVRTAIERAGQNNRDRL